MANHKMNVRKGVTVIRDDKRTRPTIGEDFTFTTEERDSILAADASALVKATGENKAETSDDASNSDGSQTKAAAAKAAKAAAAKTASTAEASQAGAKDGTKVATANTANDKSGEVAAEVKGEGDDAAGDDDL